MVNAHYNLPFNKGKTLSISGTYSEIRSSNALALTPIQGQPFVWNKGQYFDGTDLVVDHARVPDVPLVPDHGANLRRRHTSVVARNNRVQAGLWFFF